MTAGRAPVQFGQGGRNGLIPIRAASEVEAQQGEQGQGGEGVQEHDGLRGPRFLQRFTPLQIALHFLKDFSNRLNRL